MRCFVASLAAFAILGAQPKRIFTPNGDGVNDTFKVCFDNPADSVIASAQVYDLSGREVSPLKSGTSSDPACLEFMFWDGKTRSGGSVPGGVYLYKIEAEQKSFTGMVVLAR